MITKHSKPEYTTEIYTSMVLSRMTGRFESKDKRDAVAKSIKASGRKVKLTSSRCTEIHPEYVTDFVGEYETGFGNTDYQTFFRNLYTIEVIA